MKKEDLKNGAILETRSGEHCFVIDNDLFFIESGLQSDLFRFNDNLIEAEGFADDDIMKVCLEPMESNKWDWERKETPILTDDEKAFLKMLNPKWKWIVRDETGLLKLFSKKPCKKFTDRQHLIWKYNAMGGNANTMWQLLKDDMFSFIKNEDEEPYNIEELLKGSEKDEEDRTSKARP